MLDLLSAAIVVPALAALSVACFIWGCFYHSCTDISASVECSALYKKLMVKSGQAKDAPEVRSIKQAQEAALKSIAQQDAARRRSKLQDRLSAAGLTWQPMHFIAICGVIALLLFILIASRSGSIMLAAITGCLNGWILPLRYLSWRINRRKQFFLKAFPPAVEMIIRGIKSGLSLLDCLSMVANDAASPVREEFQNVVAQLAAGVPLPETMDKLAYTTPAAEVRFFTMVMSAQSQTGGNLTDALSNLLHILKQRERIAMKTRIATAEGRGSALIIGALPFLVIGGTFVFAPDYISFLWTDQTGRKVGLFSLIWLVIGILVLFRMSRFEV